MRARVSLVEVVHAHQEPDLAALGLELPPHAPRDARARISARLNSLEHGKWQPEYVAALAHLVFEGDDGIEVHGNALHSAGSHQLPSDDERAILAAEDRERAEVREMCAALGLAWSFDAAVRVGDPDATQAT